MGGVESYNEFDENDPAPEGEKQCVSEVRANGGAPVPVADARQQAHKRGPNTRRPLRHQPNNVQEREASALVISQLRRFFELLDRWDQGGPRGV